MTKTPRSWAEVKARYAEITRENARENVRLQHKWFLIFMVSGLSYAMLRVCGIF